MLKLREIPVYQPTVAVIVLILYLTLLPQPFGEEDIPLFPGADKIAHFMMFGGLTGTYIYDRWRWDKPVGLKGALVAALCSATFGAIVEWLQAAMEMGRTGNDIYDAMANTAGAFTAVAVCKALHWINVTVERHTR